MPKHKDRRYVVLIDGDPHTHWASGKCSIKTYVHESNAVKYGAECKEENPDAKVEIGILQITPIKELVRDGILQGK